MHITTRGATFHVLDVGSGDPVVFLHGTGCNARNWQPQLSALGGERRVVAPDALGHGGSDPVRDSRTLQDYVDDLLAVLTELGVERAPLVGLSMGGTIAMLAALTAPERVSGLVLANSIAFLDDEVTAGMQAGAAVALEHGMGVMAQGARDAVFAPEAVTEERPYVGEYVEQFGASDAASFAFATQAMVGLDLRTRLPGIAVPTLVLVGTADRLLPTSCSTTIADTIPGARLVELPGAGHLSNLDQQQLFTESLVEFLTSLDSPTTTPRSGDLP